MKNKTSKAYHGKLLALTALALTVTACGGGGGGGSSVSTPVTPAGLAMGAFVKTTAYAPADGSMYPFTSANASQRFQQLYLANEIGAAGYINKIGFRRNLENAQVTCANTTIKLGHTDLMELTATFSNNVENGEGTHTTVFDNKTVTIPAGTAGEYFDIALDTPFHYNGKDNLVVEFDRNAACSGTVYVSTATQTARQLAPDTEPVIAFKSSDQARIVIEPPGVLADVLRIARFSFSGGDNKLDLGGASGNGWPFTDTSVLNNERPRMQTLYLASELNGSGPITGIAFQANGTTTSGSYTYSLKLGHSTLAELTDNFANNYSGTPTTVADTVSFSVPAGITAGEWIWVPVPDGVFSYNGTDNLIVEVETTAGDSLLSLRRATFANRHMSVNNVDGTATTGVVDENVHHLALRFNGGVMQKLSANSTSNNFIFNGVYSAATLYSATDLGTSGDIKSVACRLAADAVATDYANFKVLMGHATGSTLSGTTATDFADQHTVFSGTVSIPALSKKGDWIDIPLSTPFAYDGKSNLIVWMGNDGGASPGTATVTLCSSETDAVRYASGLGANDIGVGSASYGLLDAVTDIRMSVQK